MKVIKLLLLFQLPLLSFSQSTLSSHQLKNFIIRSFHVSENISLVGIKGKLAGEGLVYLKSTKDEDWKVSNQGKALNPKVADVQAVAVINDSTFLAGTWKNGLFRTQDRGYTWAKVEKFPSNDIRSIKVSNSKLIYAATTTHGVMKSEDEGMSWSMLSNNSLSKKLAAWAIINPLAEQNTLYALTFSNGIQRTTNQGKEWVSLLVKEDFMFYDLFISKKNPNKIWAAGANDSTGVIYQSVDKGENWTLLSETPQAGFNQIAVTGENDNIIIAGSWDKGTFINTGLTWIQIEAVPFQTISGIYIDDKVSIFTWGDGVFEIKL